MSTTAGTHNKARIIAAVGASGTGKGYFVKSELLPKRGRAPAVVWSPLEQTDNYGAVLGARVVDTLPEVIAEWRAGRSVVYQPPTNPKIIAARFDLFCRAAWHMAGAWIVIEELSRVTSPSYAPPAWSNLSTAGRHRGLTLIGTAQRPAQIDKDFFGNCSEIRCFRVNYENDARAMASILRMPPGDLMELPDLHFIHRQISARENRSGAMPGANDAKKAVAPRRQKVEKNG